MHLPFANPKTQSDNSGQLKCQSWILHVRVDPFFTLYLWSSVITTYLDASDSFFINGTKFDLPMVQVTLKWLLFVPSIYLWLFHHWRRRFLWHWATLSRIIFLEIAFNDGIGTCDVTSTFPCAPIITLPEQSKLPTNTPSILMSLLALISPLLMYHLQYIGNIIDTDGFATMLLDCLSFYSQTWTYTKILNY